MPSTGPTVLAEPPSVIAQASLESEAFRIAASTPPSLAQAVQPPREPQRATRAAGAAAPALPRRRRWRR